MCALHPYYRNNTRGVKILVLMITIDYLRLNMGKIMKYFFQKNHVGQQVTSKWSNIKLSPPLAG
jgi:hypothetical protein